MARSDKRTFAKKFRRPASIKEKSRFRWEIFGKGWRAVILSAAKNPAYPPRDPSLRSG
jgi:hypothetical protein